MFFRESQVEPIWVEPRFRSRRFSVKLKIGLVKPLNSRVHGKMRPSLRHRIGSCLFPISTRTALKLYRIVSLL